VNRVGHAAMLNFPELRSPGHAHRPHSTIRHLANLSPGSQRPYKHLAAQ
jgi:hypothetical protein